MSRDIDLHMHSTASDGTDRPDELIGHVKEAGVRTFALTDHDTIRGAMEVMRLLEEGRKRGEEEPEFFRGIEFSCLTAGEHPFKCHLLGYQYDPTDEMFQAALKLDHDRRLQKTESRLAYLKDKGYDLTQEEVDWIHGLESPGKPHLGHLLLKHGYAENLQAAINLVRCREKIETRIPVRTAMEGILSSGGVPVWAHPLGGEGEKHLSQEEFERRLCYMLGQGGPEPAILGLECWYSRYDEEEIAFLLKEADKHGLLVSGGSDYHGSRKNIAIGELNAFGRPVGHEQLSLLSELRKRK